MYKEMMIMEKYFIHCTIDEVFLVEYLIDLLWKTPLVMPY